MKMTYRHLTLLLITMFLGPLAMAQEPLQVLQRSEKAMIQGGVKATFTAEDFSHGKQQGSTSGTLYFQDNKFQITTPDLITWYNGNTQWSYVKANEEVNISTPTAEEQQGMNPAALIGLYKKGYSLGLKNTAVRGKDCYEITLAAKRKSQYPQLVLLTIEKRTSLPLCIRIKKKGEKQWTRFSIYNMQTGQKYADSFFEFKATDFPQAEVIDLR